MIISLGEDLFEMQPLYPSSKIDAAAIYAIWTYDPSGDEYQLIFVGECGSEGTDIGEKNHMYQVWEDYQISGLYYSTNFMPTSKFTPEERKKEMQRLVDLYRPVSNF